MKTTHRCRITACAKIFPQRPVHRCHRCGEYVCQHHARNWSQPGAVTCARCSFRDDPWKRGERR